MLPWVCSVIDHRRRQNVVRTSVTHSAIASCATFLFLPHFDVICYLLLNRRTATWNLFVKYIILYPRILEKLSVANISEHLPSQPWYTTEDRPQHRELHALVFATSVWVLLRPTGLWTLKGCETGPKVYWQQTGPTTVKNLKNPNWPEANRLAIYKSN